MAAGPTPEPVETWPERAAASLARPRLSRICKVGRQVPPRRAEVHGGHVNAGSLPSTRQVPSKGLRSLTGCLSSSLWLPGLPLPNGHWPQNTPARHREGTRGQSLCPVHSVIAAAGVPWPPTRRGQEGPVAEHRVDRTWGAGGRGTHNRPGWTGRGTTRSEPRRACLCFSRGHT